MRHFTMAWWCGIQTGDGGDPAADYARHLEAIRCQLPPDLVAAHESLPLHDARLREMTVLKADGTARLVLDSHAGDERFTLTYSVVERVQSAADPQAGLGGPGGYGDLGYDELDILPTGAFEHRLLFSTGIELALVFRDFAFTRSVA